MTQKKIEFKIFPEELKHSAPYPVSMKKIVPDWYKHMMNHVTSEKNPKKLSKYYDIDSGQAVDSRTIKTCVPVRDVMTAGYALLLQCDVIATNHKINSNMEGIGFDWSDTNFDLFGRHPVSQFEGSSSLKAGASNGDIFKFNNPWRIKTPRGYSCYFRPPAYHDLPFEVLPAVVDTDDMHIINFPFIWKDNKEPQVLLKKGTPIVQVIPFKRDEWVMECGSESVENETIRETSFRSVFSNWYRTYAHKKKKYD